MVTTDAGPRIASSDPWSAHLSLLFREIEIGSRPRAAANHGFRWVESWWIDDELERDRFARSAMNSEVGLACMNAFAGDLASGDRGFMNSPDRRDEAIASVAAAVEFVAGLKGRSVNVLVGRAHRDAMIPRQLAQVRDVLAELAPVAASAGVTLVVEHLNRGDVPNYLIPTPESCARLVESVGHDSVRMLFDAYHAVAMGLSLKSEIARFGDLSGTPNMQALLGDWDPEGGESTLGSMPPCSRTSATPVRSGLSSPWRTRRMTRSTS